MDFSQVESIDNLILTKEYCHLEHIKKKSKCWLCIHFINNLDGYARYLITEKRFIR